MLKAGQLQGPEGEEHCSIGKKSQKPSDVHTSRKSLQIATMLMHGAALYSQELEQSKAL